MLLHNFRFIDRTHAGRELGRRLLIREFSNPVVLALPRGGVTVAEEVARLLGAPLDVVVARKIGAPEHQEFGIGALSEDEIPHFNPKTMNYFDVTSPEIKAIVNAETAELRRRISQYRVGRNLPDLKDKAVIVVDDGLATGVTAAAAGAFLRTRNPRELIFAAPVCPDVISSEVREQFDEIVCLKNPQHFQSVGEWYEDFNQVEDDEVMSILTRHHLNAQLPRGEIKQNLNRTIL